MYPASRPRASDMEQPGASPLPEQRYPLALGSAKRVPVSRSPPGETPMRASSYAPGRAWKCRVGQERRCSHRHRGRRPRNSHPHTSTRRRSGQRRRCAIPASRYAVRTHGDGSFAPLPRAMPVGDRRSTAVRASGGLHFHANWRAAHVAAPPAGTATNTESAPATCTCRRTRYCDMSLASRPSLATCDPRRIGYCDMCRRCSWTLGLETPTLTHRVRPGDGEGGPSVRRRRRPSRHPATRKPRTAPRRRSSHPR